MSRTAVSPSGKRKTVRLGIIALFGLLSVLSIFICTGIGSVKFSVSEVARALFVDDESTARLLIWNLRFPRVLVGGLVGICLSLSGCSSRRRIYSSTSPLLNPISCSVIIKLSRSRS